jgi:hypothetical protein
LPTTANWRGAMKILFPSFALLTACGFALFPTAHAEPPASTAEKIHFALKAREKAPIQNLEHPLEVGNLKFNRIAPDRGLVYLDAGKGVRFLVTDSKLPSLEKIMAAKSVGDLLGILSVSDSKEGLWNAIDEADPKAYLASMKHEALGQTFRIAYLHASHIAIVTVQALLPAPVEGKELEDRRVASIAVDIKMVSLSGAPLLTPDVLGN